MSSIFEIRNSFFVCLNESKSADLEKQSLPQLDGTEIEAHIGLSVPTTAWISLDVAAVIHANAIAIAGR